MELFTRVSNLTTTNLNYKVMEAKDLMIGDWFYRPDCYDQVKEIRQNGIIGLDSLRGLIGFSELKPIPLAPEILEKIGFKRDPLWHHCDKDLDNYSISVQLGYANRIEYIEIKEKSKDDFVPSKRTKLYLTHIKYVHELQRALRLCRIEKEIIL